jgi:hypothetical protein
MFRAHYLFLGLQNLLELFAQPYMRLSTLWKKQSLYRLGRRMLSAVVLAAEPSFTSLRKVGNGLKVLGPFLKNSEK